MTEEKNKTYFPNLDGLRFFSFFIVFLAHSMATKESSILQSDWYQFFKVRMFSDGDIGVSFFFVLSGFLITYLLLKEVEHKERIALKAFYIRRALRIWPLYFFCVFFGFIIFPYLKTKFGQVPNETADPFLCSFFLNNFNMILHGMPDASVLAVLWSVAIEEQFYLIWPLLFIVFPRNYYGYIFFLVVIASLVYRGFYQESFREEAHTLSVISDMAIGGLGAFLILKKPLFLEAVKKSNPLLNMLPYAMVLVFIVYREQLFAFPVMNLFKRIIMTLFFCWIILEQNFCVRSYFKIGNFKIISQLGKYTYGLYCLHTIAILVVVTVLNKLHFNQHAWQILLLEIPLSMLLSIGISYMSYHLYESHFLKLKEKFQTAGK